ncbi:hypothetical protein A4A49_56553, partial [Nicotiana attenuata]
PRQSVTTTELYALLHGLILAKLYNLLPIQVEIDAKEVITLLHVGNLNFANLLTDCRHLLWMLHHPTVSHAYREQNKLADQLAKSESFLDGTYNIHVLNQLPPFVKKIWENDQQLMSATHSIPLPVAHLHDQVIPDSNCFCTNSSTRNATNNIVITSNMLVCNMVTTSLNALACNRVQPEH